MPTLYVAGQPIGLAAQLQSAQRRRAQLHCFLATPCGGCTAAIRVAVVESAQMGRARRAACISMKVSLDGRATEFGRPLPRTVRRQRATGSPNSRPIRRVAPGLRNTCLPAPVSGLGCPPARIKPSRHPFSARCAWSADMRRPTRSHRTPADCRVDLGPCDGVFGRLAVRTSAEATARGVLASTRSRALGSGTFLSSLSSHQSGPLAQQHWLRAPPAFRALHRPAARRVLDEIATQNWQRSLHGDELRTAESPNATSATKSRSGHPWPLRVTPLRKSARGSRLETRSCHRPPACPDCIVVGRGGRCALLRSGQRSRPRRTRWARSTDSAEPPRCASVRLFRCLVGPWSPRASLRERGSSAPPAARKRPQRVPPCSASGRPCVHKRDSEGRRDRQKEKHHEGRRPAGRMARALRAISR